MVTQTFIQTYQAYLKANYNSERAVKEKAYLYSDLKHYGVSVWQREAYFKKHKRVISNLSKKEALALVQKLWSFPSFEERSLALEVLQLHADKLELSDMPLIERLMRESRGWALLDSLIVPIMPMILAKFPAAFGYLKTWIKDEDFWVRRSALLAQLLFFRRGQGGNRELFFEFARSQFDERWIDQEHKDKLLNKRAKFFIRKAIGWMLREMSRKNPEIVFKFLKKNRNHMSGLSFREGSRKLPQALRIELLPNSL